MIVGDSENAYLIVDKHIIHEIAIVDVPYALMAVFCIQYLLS